MVLQPTFEIGRPEPTTQCIDENVRKQWCSISTVILPKIDHHCIGQTGRPSEYCQAHSPPQVCHWIEMGSWIGWQEIWRHSDSIEWWHWCNWPSRFKTFWTPTLLVNPASYILPSPKPWTNTNKSNSARTVTEKGDGDGEDSGDEPDEPIECHE